jgi:tetratricopeptide (TPR) repeat protein
MTLPGRILRIALGVVPLALLVFAGWVVADWWIAFPPDALLRAEYVGREDCARCHEQEVDLWLGSDHERAMALATPDSVLGDFNDRKFLHFGFEDVARLADAAIERLAEDVPPPQWAAALRDPTRGVEQKIAAVRERLEAALPGERFDEIREIADSLEVVRPCDAIEAQEEIVQLVRRLVDEGEVEVPDPVFSRLFRRDGKYYVTTDGPTGKMETFEVTHTFGWQPLQQYLIPLGGGRVQCLPIAWDTQRKRWFHLYPGERILHDDPLHWTRPLQNWNYMCAECHTTNLQKNFDLETNTYRTTFSEINVSCETCHGPGSLHSRLADTKWFFWDRRHGFGLPRLKDPDARVEIESCAPCHARRQVIYPGFLPGAKFLDHYVPEMLDGELYYPDGQILDEDFEYGSYLQSKMYAQGVRCSDCHDPHTAHVKYSDPGGPWNQPVDDRVCTDCHMGTHPAGKYDTPAHHYHPDATQPGTRCVECHMVETTYMVVDPRRDHSFRNPRPDLTIALGVPNACNLCHNDLSKGETAEWAEATLVEWYGERKGPPHFAHAIAAGRRGEPGAERALEALTRRRDESGIVRASAMLLLGRYGNSTARAAASRLRDDDDGLVRLAAVRGFQGLSHEAAQRARGRAPRDPAQAAHIAELRRALGPMLDDPLRAVRIEAARLLSVVPRESLSVRDLRAFDAALEEYLAGQRFLGDQPAAHLNIAVAHANQGDAPAALGAYATALRLDPEFVPARVNRAMLYDELGRKEEAAKDLRRAIELEPDVAEMHYSLGLLLAEDAATLDEAAGHLAEAVRLAPDHARMRYNYGLALQHLDKADEAEEQLRRAFELSPGEIDVLHALVILYAQQERWDRALAGAEELVRRQPGERGWRELLDHLRRQADAGGRQP